jgi:hypothetical protein
MSPGFCLDNVSLLATMVKGMDSARLAAVPTNVKQLAMAPLSLASSHSLLQANGIATLLGNVPVPSATVAKVGILSQLGALASNISNVFNLGASPTAGANLVSARLQAITQALERALQMRPPVAPAITQARVQLGWAAATLAPLGIDIFSKTGADKLVEYLRHLQSSGSVREMQVPRISTSMFDGLLRLASFSESVPGFPRPPGSGRGMGLSASGIEALLARSKVGPAGFVLSGEGRGLIPSAERLGQLSGVLAGLRIERGMRIGALPKLGLPSRQPADPFAALEASGCCQVLQGFKELQSCSMGAARLDALGRGMSVAQSRFGVDLRAPDAAKKLGAGLLQVQQVLDKTLVKVPPVSPAGAGDLARACQFFASVLQAKELGLLGRL